eukprot:ANDGO_02294.mRNA.1 Protein farnesyltransferase/geranylgeranyltransferase type-1 subunit alpha
MSHISYAQRSEWKDVVPIYQEEGPDALVPISYSEEFKDVMDYMRAIIRSEEVSLRAFNLTTDAVRLNPANYTVWTFRRRIIFQLGLDLSAEMKFTASMIEENPKNYQVWHHMQLLKERYGQSDPHDIPFVKRQLAEDSKNYHAWSYLQWLVEFSGKWEESLGLTAEFIEQDVRNNSAWNHRFWCLQRTHKLTQSALLLAEITYVFTMIEKAPNNESVWNYLQGICRSGTREQYKHVLDLVSSVLATNPHCIPAISAKLQLFSDASMSDTVEIRMQCAELCDQLVTLDGVRSRYWSHRRSLYRR